MKNNDSKLNKLRKRKKADCNLNMETLKKKKKKRVGGGGGGDVALLLSAPDAVIHVTLK